MRFLRMVIIMIENENIFGASKKTDTCAAVSTAAGVGGIAVIRISGDAAIKIADAVFVGKSGVYLRDKKGYSASFGTIEMAGITIDSGVATVFRAPNSYTGEDIVEISCHGGMVVTREVLRAVLSSGARLAQPGEFTKRAFLNGKMSLTQAEAVADIISSRNVQAMRAAKSQLDGSTWASIQLIKNRMLKIAGQLAAWVDYPDDDIPDVENGALLLSLSEIGKSLENLFTNYDKGQLLKEGIDTVIIGKPNVGKSTIMNLLVGAPKSIVTEIAGTTRDVIEETIQLGDIMLKLSDTAGIRNTSDIVEQQGVEMARKLVGNSTLVLAIFDNSSEISDEDKEIIECIGDRLAIAVINKIDKESKIDIEFISAHFTNIVNISAKTDNNLAPLERMIISKLELQDIDVTVSMLANERQRGCVLHAHEAIKEAIAALQGGMTLDAVTISIEQAIEEFLSLSGENITEQLVNQVFSNFCVGK